MTPNEAARWSAHHTTPITFNHHSPIVVNASEVQHVDLNPIKSTTSAVANRERVLILTPLRNAAQHLPSYFDLLDQLTYPHDLIDVAFLVGDSTDDTLAVLSSELARQQKSHSSSSDEKQSRTPFRSATIIEKDFGVTLSQDVGDRHGWRAQGPRRKAMARARNYLLYSALRPEHSWVFWRDVDIQESPKSILEDFVGHDRDVVVPNIWFHRFKKENGEMKDIMGRCEYI